MYDGDRGDNRCTSLVKDGMGDNTDSDTKLNIILNIILMYTLTESRLLGALSLVHSFMV